MRSILELVRIKRNGVKFKFKLRGATTLKKISSSHSFSCFIFGGLTIFPSSYVIFFIENRSSWAQNVHCWGKVESRSSQIFYFKFQVLNLYLIWIEGFNTCLIPFKTHDSNLAAFNNNFLKLDLKLKILQNSLEICTKNISWMNWIFYIFENFGVRFRYFKVFF